MLSDATLLDISEVELADIKFLEADPVVVVQFNCQQVTTPIRSTVMLSSKTATHCTKGRQGQLAALHLQQAADGRIDGALKRGDFLLCRSTARATSLGTSQRERPTMCSASTTSGPCSRCHTIHPNGTSNRTAQYLFKAAATSRS